MPDVPFTRFEERMRDPEFRDKMSRQVASVFIIQDGHNMQSFTKACQKNHVELLDLRPAPDNIKEMGLIVAIRHGAHDCIDKLVEMGVNTYHGLGSAFHECIKQNDLEAFQKLDTKNEAVAKYGAPLLKEAVEANSADAIHFLVEAGADINLCNLELMKTCLEPSDKPVRVQALEAVMHYILSPDFKYLDAAIDHRKRMPYNHQKVQRNMVGVVETEELIKKSKARCISMSHLHMMRNSSTSINAERAKITCSKMFEMAIADKPQIPPSVAEQFARMDRQENKNKFWHKMSKIMKR